MKERAHNATARYMTALNKTARRAITHSTTAHNASAPNTTAGNADRMMAKIEDPKQGKVTERNSKSSKNTHSNSGITSKHQNKSILVLFRNAKQAREYALDHGVSHIDKDHKVTYFVQLYCNAFADELVSQPDNILHY